MLVTLKKDLEILTAMGTKVLVPAMTEVFVDFDEGIAYHDETDTHFYIYPDEYAIAEEWQAV
jgi:hypothetical protein